MNSLYFSKFNIAFTGFEKKTQQKLESLLIEKTELLEEITIINENYNSELVIHFYFLNNISDCKTYDLKRSNTINERILHVSEFNDFEELLSCIRTGCYGCISAENIFKEIYFALLAALQNKIYISSAFAASINNYFKKSNRKHNYADLFTHREHKLIELLTTGALYKEIAWKMDISENTVRSHIRNIYSKLKVHSKTELTQKILKSHFITSILYFFSDYIACLCY